MAKPETGDEVTTTSRWCPVGGRAVDAWRADPPDTHQEALDRVANAF